MTDFKILSAREAAKILVECENPTVIMHVRPDGDTVGSASALALALKSLEKTVRIISADKIPARLSFLTEGIDVGEDIGDGDLISIDVAAPNQLGRFADKKIKLMIDHHAIGTRFADSYIIPDCSSAAEVLFDILTELEKISDFKMNTEIAARVYAAISSDTGGFVYSNATSKTYRIAASLIDFEIDAADINHRLFHSKSEEQIKAEGYTSSKIKTVMNGKIAYATLSMRERENLGISLEFFDTAIDVVRSVMGAEIAVFIREVENKKFRASIRSTGADVASVAAKFSGGGHIRAAGCSPEGECVEEAAQKLLSALSEIYKQ